ESQLVARVVLKVFDDPEATPQWTRDEAGPRGGADQGEARQVEPDRTRRRPLAQHDVDLVLLHGGVEVLLCHAAEPVNLVYEQDVAVLKRVGEYGCQVARLLDGWARGDADADAHLVGDY